MGSKILAGRYELIEKIGDGGMAVVYKAKDRLLNRFVAIKILKPEFIKDPKFTDSFRRESQAAAGLSHPNIVSVYDVGKEGNIYYIVMEVLEGDTLSDVIKREGRLDEKKAIDIAKKIALALSAAHKKNIIHRDVKPHNILITEDGTVKIADFGIAKTVNSGTIVNNTNTVMGSVHYLSPEQARGGYVDARSDIYSLGIVLYEMLTGTVPFDGDNPVSVAMMHMNEDVKPPSLVNPAVSPELDSVVLKATAKHQPDRYKSADEFFEALKEAESAIDSRRSGYGLTAFYAIAKDGQSEVPADGGFSGYEGGDEDEDDVFPFRRKKNKKPKKQKKNDGGKKSKKTRILAVVLALVCAIPLSMLLLNAFGGSGKTVAIPDVLGMTEEDAAKELEKAGLEYKRGTPVLSDEYDTGEVVSTDPEIGRKVKKGYTVKLIPSKGSDGETVRVPNTVGKNLDVAKDLLEDYDLKCGNVSYDEDSDLPEGTVVSQDPDAGEEVDAGSSVNLVVSSGSATSTVKVPSLLNKSQEAAQAALEAVGLKLGSVDTAHSDSVEEGLVISQQYEKGTELEEGASVSITISSGPEQQEPEYVSIPLTVDYSGAENEVFVLTVTVTDSNGLHYIVNNQQRQKSSGSEQVVLTGTGTDAVVRVIIDNQIVAEYSANFETGDLN